MGKRKKKKIKSGIKYEPPDEKMGKPTAVVNQAKHWKPPDSELRLRNLEKELHRKRIEHWVLRMEKLLIGLHRSRIENKIDELQLEQLLEKLDEKHRRLIATRYCYPKESWENVPLEMTQVMPSEQHRSVSIGTLQYGNDTHL